MFLAEKLFTSAAELFYFHLQIYFLGSSKILFFKSKPKMFALLYCVTEPDAIRLNLKEMSTDQFTKKQIILRSIPTIQSRLSP